MRGPVGGAGRLGFGPLAPLEEALGVERTIGVMAEAVREGVAELFECVVLIAPWIWAVEKGTVFAMVVHVYLPEERFWELSAGSWQFHEEKSSDNSHGLEFLDDPFPLDFGRDLLLG